MLALGLNSNGELGPLEEPFRVRVVGSGVVVVGRWEAVVGRWGVVEVEEVEDGLYWLVGRFVGTWVEWKAE